MAKNKLNDGKLLVESLAKWGNANGIYEDPYVVGVSDAIYKNRSLDVWNQFDPLQYLPQVPVQDGASSLKWGRIIGIIRNILVFAPVALTWKGVEQATTAFSKFVSENSGSTLNFLEFWQNGYDVLPSEWTISNIARMDYMIVGIIILLSLLSTFLNEHGRALRTAGQKTFDADRTYLAIEIKKYLHSKREISNVTINDGLSEVMRSFENSAKSISGLADKLESAAKKHPSDLSFRSEYKDFFNRLNSALKKRENN